MLETEGKRHGGLQGTTVEEDFVYGGHKHQ